MGYSNPKSSTNFDWKTSKHHDYNLRFCPIVPAGGGNQGAIPPAVFNALREWWPQPEPVEAFASPLNLGIDGN